MIEPLEARQLFAARVLHDHVTYGFIGGDNPVLQLSGSRFDDTIKIERAHGGLLLTLNGKEVLFGNFSGFILYAGLGNDTVINKADSFNGLIDGGAGNDSLTSGKSDDTLIGNEGNDTLVGDTYYAENGRDYLDGGPGNDVLAFGLTMYGGSGRDKATVTYSNETITGGLEQYTYDDLEFTRSALPIDKQNVFSKSGKLVFEFTTDGYTQESVGAPYTLGDGRFTLVVHRIVTPPTAGPPPVRTARFNFNPREANRHGIVLQFTVPGSSRIDASLDQTVLIATR